MALFQQVRSTTLLSARHRGGTLLEVLISLVIVLLIVDVVLQAKAQQRLVIRFTNDQAQGNACAMQWRSARSHQNQWAMGEEGSVPDAPLNWRLKEAVSYPDESAIKPDENWRQLEFCRIGESQSFWQIVIYLNSAPPTTQPALNSESANVTAPERGRLTRG